MGFPERLRALMMTHGGDEAALAKRAGVPYVEVVALFKRRWEKAPVWIVCAICEAYNVSMDYIVRGKNAGKDIN